MTRGEEALHFRQRVAVPAGHEVLDAQSSVLLMVIHACVQGLLALSGKSHRDHLRQHIPIKAMRFNMKGMMQGEEGEEGEGEGDDGGRGRRR